MWHKAPCSSRDYSRVWESGPRKRDEDGDGDVDEDDHRGDDSPPNEDDHRERGGEVLPLVLPPPWPPPYGPWPS